MTTFRSVLCTDGREYSFEEAVLAGWADDGGMLLPTVIPTVDRPTLRRWAALSYPALCAEVLKLFVPPDAARGGIAHADLEAIVLGCFGRFGHRDVVTVRELVPAAGAGVAAATEKEEEEEEGARRSSSPLLARGEVRGAKLHVAELWHGPTLAFKDLGMSVLGALLNHLLLRRGARTTLLVGTSGDTGSSAIEAVRGLPAIQLVVLYPLGGRCTAVQERQMTHAAAAARNVHLVGVEGSSDDLDVPMEACFRDLRFKRAQSLGSINSVNVARLLVQTVHFFYAYLRVNPAADDAAAGPVAFSVPSGAAGHLSAGALALRMGLPSAALLASVNANDSLHRLLRDGEMAAGPAAAGGRAVRTTISPSMDICVPYNVWRLLALTGACGPEQMRALQAQLIAPSGGGRAVGGAMRLPPALRDALRSLLGVRSAAVGEQETLATIRAVHSATGGTHLIDTHTAVGIAGAAKVLASAGGGEGAAAGAGSEHGGGLCGARHVICMGCAHPAKFLPAVSEAVLGAGREAELRAALGAGAEARAHPCVASVLAIGEGADRASATPGLPYGCCEALRAGDGDWEAKTRRVIEQAWAVAPPPAQGGAQQSSSRL